MPRFRSAKRNMTAAIAVALKKALNNIEKRPVRQSPRGLDKKTNPAAAEPKAT